MNKRVFSQAVGVGLAIVTVSSFSSLAAIFPWGGSAIAQSQTSRHSSAAAPAMELAQTPTVENSTMARPEGTLVFSQTPCIAVRVYTSQGAPRLNLYNKQTGVTEVRSAPVTVASTNAGVTYRYAGELSVEVAIANSGEQTITVNGLSQADEAITGTVFYLPRIALPPNAIIEISLVDVSRADAPAITLASQQIVANGRQVPFPFTLPYDSGQIDPRSSYAVQARITVGGELQFVAKSRFSVITNGSPTKVEVQVEPVDQAVPDETQTKNN